MEKVSQPLINVVDLVITYSRGVLFNRDKIVAQVAANNISFSVHQGETLAIVGQSGSGKTSLAMAILGFVKPTTGEIKFTGENINNLSNTQYRQYRARIQPIFQDCGAALNPQMTVGQAIGDGFPNSLPKSQRKTSLRELMVKVGLDEKIFSAFPRQLCGGQKQRVCLARALATGADFLILDEPFSAQDTLHQAQLMSLLRQLKNSHNLTYLLISHDLMTVRLLADRILVLRSGKIIESGSVTEIFKAPHNEYTRELVLRAGILPQ